MKTLHDSNPLAPRQSDFVALIEPGDEMTPNRIILQNALAFHGPVVCMVDDGFWLRADWDCPIPVGATVRFIEAPQGDIFGKILGAIAVIVASIYFPGALGLTGMAATLMGAAISIAGSILLGMMFGATAATNSDQGTPATVYGLSNVNRARRGEPFAERFGRRPFYPDVAMSYTRFENNEQYLYLLLIVGIGNYSTIVPTIGKTPLSDYAGVTTSTVQPGVTPTICPNVVWTSTEVSSQELDTDYVNFVVNPRGTLAYFIEYDVVFPGGLIGYNDEGDPYSVTVSLLPRCRLVDDYGNPTSDWVNLPVPGGGIDVVAQNLSQFTMGLGGWSPSAYSAINANAVGFTAASKDPRRWTKTVPVPLGPGRYEFSVRRANAASSDAKVMDRCSLAGLRAIGGAHPPVSGVTMWEAKILATNQMNADSGSKIQLEATRMLYPVTSTGFGSTLTATRSIVDACAYIVTGENGGRQGPSILAWDVLAELRSDFAAKGYWFDHGFTGRVSVMDACSTVAACAAAVPYTPGGLFCLAANTLQLTHGVPFTDDDFDPDSLRITTTFRTPASKTCVRVKYYDPATGQDETVDCYETGGSVLNPQEVALDGCVSRQQAWEVGLLLYRDMVKSRVNVEFTTGLKGNLPSLFSWIPVASTVANWNQTGVVAAVESGGVFWTSEPVDFEGEETGWLLLALPDGTKGGPYVVTPTASAHKVITSTPIATSLATTIQDDDVRATRYIFGPASKNERLVRVMAIVPEGRDKVTISGQVVVEEIYDAFGTAPGFESNVVTGAPLMSVGVYFQEYAGSAYSFYASWIGSAPEYRVEINTGAGYSIIQDNYTAFATAFTVAGSTVTVRVTPYVNSSLATDSALVVTYSIAPAPAGLAVVVTNESVAVSWNAVASATKYQVELFVGATSVGMREVTTTSTIFTTAQLQALGGPWATFAVRVRAIVNAIPTLDAVETVGVSPLAAPTGLTLQSTLSSAVILSWNAVAGATGYRLYLGTSSGFNPATNGSLKYSGSNTSATVSVSLVAPYAHYFRVAATDAYHQNASDLTFSGTLEVSG